MSLALAEEEMSLRVQIEAVLDACPTLPMPPSYTDRFALEAPRFELTRNVALLLTMSQNASAEVRERFAQRQRADEVAMEAEYAQL